MTNQRRRSVSHFLRYRNRDRLRVNVPHHCLKQLDEIKNHLKLRSHSGAVDWLLGHDMKGLVELTNELGYANGGQTIDWLLAMGMGTERIVNFRQGQIGGQTVNLSLPSETRALVELTRELGFNRGGETVDWLLQMATNPMIELMNSLGFKSGTKTIDWLLNQAQPSIAAAKLNGFKPSEPPKLSSGVNITPQFSSKQLKTPGFQTPEFHNFNTQPHNQLESNHGQRFTEKQQQVQFDSNGSGELAERYFLNGNGGLSNRSSGVKRGRQEAEYSNHAGNHLQILDSSGHRGSETQIGRASTNSAQGLRQNPNIGFDAGYAKRVQSEIRIGRATTNSAQGLRQNPNIGFDAGYAEHVQNNSIINGNTSQQNEFSGQPPDPKALLDFYFANLNLVENMDPQSVLKIFYAQNQKQFINIHAQNQNQFVNSHDQNQNHFENIQPQSQFEHIHTLNQNQFVNNHAQNQNQFVNGHDQNQNLYENIHPQSQFENIHDQNQNRFVNIQDQNQNRFVNIHDQNQGGYQGNQAGREFRIFAIT